MPLNAKFVHSQLALIQPLLSSCSLKTIRKGQNRMGQLVSGMYADAFFYKTHSFPQFEGTWILPKDQRRPGILLYLHGGGYTCGDMEYAKGFGSVLCDLYGCRVFCPAYRLAPETPFPGALEDAVTAYSYLLEKGYQDIVLCGESAGGGLCFGLCLKLKELGLPQPKGIVAFSPWVDLSLTGPSIEENAQKDVSLTRKQLRFYAEAYTDTPEAPFASPLFGALSQLPPTILFAAEDELLRDDAVRLYEKLLAACVPSKLYIRPDRWHAYLLYGLPEDRKDHQLIESFLDKHMGQARKLRWMKLDNAAKIYPAARSDRWSSIYRLSATLHEKIDAAVMQKALDITARRFPSISVRLRKGLFWYYLQQLSEAPPLQPEYSYPLTKMSRQEVRKCAFRVIVYENRVAVEMFHSITDGSGALVFLKSLVAEYLLQKYGVHIPAEQGILGRLEAPLEAEMEDSFLKYAGKRTASRKETKAWRLSGTSEQRGFQHVTCLTVPVDQALELAHREQVSLTAFLAAVMLQALQRLQAEKIPDVRARKPLKVQIPVNLRTIFPSRTLRNFALYTTPEIDPRLGSYEFSEICQVVKSKMGMDITPKQLSMKIATNVASEKLMAVRLMPLFIKNLVMKAIFDSVGEQSQCLSMSNLGQIRLPEEMMAYVKRMDFILGVQSSAPHNCGVLSLGDTLYINFIRDIRESDLEYHFFCVLRDMGLPVQVQSNDVPGKGD